MTQDVNEIGLKDAMSDAGFDALRRGIMIAFLHICGRVPWLKDWLKISRRICLACGPKAARNVAGMLSWPGVVVVVTFI